MQATDLPVAGLLDVALLDDGRQQECRGPQLVSDALATTECVRVSKPYFGYAAPPMRHVQEDERSQRLTDRGLHRTDICRLASLVAE